MARNIKKLPKWAIKQAGGINKKAWRLARRGRGRKRRGMPGKKRRKAFRKRRAARRGNPGHRPMGIVGKINAGLRAFKFALPAVGTYLNQGLTDFPRGAIIRYAGFDIDSKEFSEAHVKSTAGFYAGNIVEGKALSFLKVPQMAGKKKILAIAGQYLPEIQAVTDLAQGSDPATVTSDYAKRSIGYEPIGHASFVTNAAIRDEWIKTLGARIGLGVVSRFAGPMINKHLPKGINI